MVRRRQPDTPPLARDDRVHLQRQRRGERLRHPTFERIARDLAHFLPDRVERLSFTLPDLDGEQLQQWR